MEKNDFPQLITYFIIFPLFFSCSISKKNTRPILGPPPPPPVVIIPEKKQEQPKVVFERSNGIDPVSAFRLHGTKALDVLMETTTGGIAGSIISKTMDSIANRITNSIPGASVERITEGITIMFETRLNDENELSLSKEKLSVWDNEDPTLKELTHIIKEYPQIDILIESHFYGKGIGSDKAGYAKRRADAFRKFFHQQGIDSRRIITKAYDRNPLAVNKLKSSSTSKIQFVLTAGAMMKERAKRMADLL